MEGMEVNSPRPRTGGQDYAERASARRDGRTLDDGDIRGRVQQVTIRQQRFERFLSRELGIDQGGLEVLDHLLSMGPATPTELAHKLEISTAAMTLVLNRLEAAGHISRERHPSDGRKLIVTPSEQIAADARACVMPLIDGVEDLIGSLSTEEAAVVGAFLERLVGVYDAVTGPVRATVKT